MSDPQVSQVRDEDTIRAVRRQSLSVGIATGTYGVSFGALAVASGLNVPQTVALSALMFTGGSQFALIGILGSGGAGAGAAAIATACLLGVRNGLYALETSHLLKVAGWRRIAAAHLTIDESTAVGVSQPTAHAGRLGFWWTGLAVFVFWNLMTLVGALLGNALGDPKRFGLDAAAVGAFCALLWPRLKGLEPVAVAVGAAFIALVLAPRAPVGVPVLASAGAALVAGLLHRGGPVDPGVVEDPEVHT